MAVVALEQLEVEVGAVEANRALVVDRAHRALDAGADVVVLPELVVSGYTTDPDLVAEVAEPLDGPTVQALTDVAGDGLVVVGLCERAGDAYFNAVVAVGADGPVLHYRKLHLFDAEQRVYTPGDLGLPVVETRWGRLGASICYDLRFVEVLRALSLRGADLVCAPAAWVGGFDRDVPPAGLSQQAQGVVVQANLDQVAVAAVSQVGTLPDGTGLLGGSVLVDAYGRVPAGPLSRTAPDAAAAELDLLADRSAQVRSERIRPRTDRRTDVYQCLYQGSPL